MASIKKRDNGAWRAQVAINGTRESKTFTTRAEAVAWAADRESSIRAGAAGGIVLGKTLGDAFDRYAADVSPHKRGAKWEQTRLLYIGACEVSGVPLRRVPLADITPDIFGRWRDARLATVKGSTIIRDMGLISSVLRVACREWRWCATNPLADVRRPANSKSRERLPTQGEIDALCQVLGFSGGPARTKGHAVAVAFLFAIETAMRAGEICALQEGDTNGRTATLRMTKNGESRQVPLSTRAVELLDMLPARGAGECLFGLTPATLDANFRKAKTRAQVQGLTFHDTRHAAITRLARKLDVLALARMVGHRDLRQLQTYYNEGAESIALRLD